MTTRSRIAGWLREALLWTGAALGLLALAAGVAVTFFGFSFLVFRSGSMSPAIPTGALALSHEVPAADVTKGDVVSVISAEGQRITHRVVGNTVRGEDASLILQGDANGTPDGEIYQARTVDRVVASVPYGGYVIVHVLTPPGLVAVTALSLMLLLLGPRRRPAGTEDVEDVGGVDTGIPGGLAQPVLTSRPQPVVQLVRPAYVAPVPRTRAHRRQISAAGRVVVLLAGAGVLGAAAAHRRRRRMLGLLGAAVVGGSLLVNATLSGHGAHGTLAYFTDKATVSTGSFNAAQFFTCNNAVLQNGTAPYLSYQLDENPPTPAGLVDGTAADSSGNGRNAPYRGASVLPPAAGKAYSASKACARDTGGSITFDGVRGYASSAASVAPVSAWNTFTLSMWFNTTTTAGGWMLGMQASNGAPSGPNDRKLYMANNGQITFGVYPTSGTGANNVQVLTSPGTYRDGAWHNVVATLSTAGMVLYVDGAQVNARSDITTASQEAGYTNSAFWRLAYGTLGGWRNGTGLPTVDSEYFQGSLDEVAIYQSALSASTIAAMYRAGK